MILSVLDSLVEQLDGWGGNASAVQSGDWRDSPRGGYGRTGAGQDDDARWPNDDRLPGATDPSRARAGQADGALPGEAGAWNAGPAWLPGRRSGQDALRDAIEMMRMARSMVKLWSGQNTALMAESRDVRDWMATQLPAINERLENLDRQFTGGITRLQAELGDAENDPLPEDDGRDGAQADKDVDTGICDCDGA